LPLQVTCAVPYWVEMVPAPVTELQLLVPPPVPPVPPVLVTGTMLLTQTL
jgi:hypothetical protein